MPKLKTLDIHTTQGFSGALTRESQFVFNYRTADPSCEIALSMPLREQSYAANIVPGVLRQNLPEGFLLGWIKERFAKTTKVDDMTILAITGREVIGRVKSFQTGDNGETRHKALNLNEILTWKGTEDLFLDLAEQYATCSGISGIQPKIVAMVHVDSDNDTVEKISIKDRNVIIKSGGEDYPGLAENEFICMSIAKAADLETPAFWLSDDRKLFVIERFDMAETGYLGFEDMTSLMNKQNDEKYGSSYEMVAKAVDLFTSESWKSKSLNDLFASITLSTLLRNGDAHLKNFGLLYTDPTSNDCRLSPLYDIVNTTTYIPRDTMALKLGGTKAWPSTRNLIEFGKSHCRVDRPEMVIEKIATIASEHRPAESSDIWKKMKAEIDYACFGLAGGNTKHSAVKPKQLCP